MPSITLSGHITGADGTSVAGVTVQLAGTSPVDAPQKNPPMVCGPSHDAACTIGLLLCKTNNRVIAEYALRDVNKPIGVAEYQLVQALTAQLEASLPSIERLQAELTEVDIDELEKIHHGAGGDSTTTPPTAKPRPAPADNRRATRTTKDSPGKKVPRPKKSPPSKNARR